MSSIAIFHIFRNAKTHSGLSSSSYTSLTDTEKHGQTWALPKIYEFSGSISTSLCCLDWLRGSFLLLSISHSYCLALLNTYSVYNETSALWLCNSKINFIGRHAISLCFLKFSLCMILRDIDFGFGGFGDTYFIYSNALWRGHLYSRLLDLQLQIIPFYT